jgi:hypothetical protein
MTGPENYAEAERLIDLAREEGGGRYVNNPNRVQGFLAEAQVRATLALAAATGVHDAGVVP